MMDFLGYTATALTFVGAMMAGWGIAGLFIYGDL